MLCMVVNSYTYYTNVLLYTKLNALFSNAGLKNVLKAF